jgi:protein subunit release factor B
LSTFPSAASSLLREARRASHVSSFKVEGYYRLANPKQITIDPSVYEIRTMRGSGPGGQGTNSSSNKVELRADLEMLSGFFDKELLAALRRNETGASLTADGTTIVVSCHEHRSGLQNKEGCIRKLQELLHKASWVPPVEADPIELPTRIVTERKLKRRKKSNANRMTRTARSGSW